MRVSDLEPMSALAPDQIKLELIGLSKSYGGKKAVDCPYLPVGKGEFLTLLGPSGSGKTTLLTMIAGFVDPDTGEIVLEGVDIAKKAPEKRNFGMMFQGYALFPHMTVAENVAFPLVVRHLPRSEIDRRVRKALAQVKLENFNERLPKQLSGGQQQRVALARATVFDPELLLLDEPLSALDRKLRGEMQAEIKHAHAALGKTFIYVTHDQDEALTLSDRIVILRDGDIVQIGSPTDLYERPISRFVASFLGQSNFLSGLAETSDGEHILYDVGGTKFVHRGPLARNLCQATLSLRPEKLTIHADKNALSASNKIRGVITERSYLGSNIVYLVDTRELGPVTVSRPAWGIQFKDTINQDVWLGWEPDATVSVNND